MLAALPSIKQRHMAAFLWRHEGRRLFISLALLIDEAHQASNMMMHYD